MKARCDNCPARNNRVRAYEIKSGALVTKRMALCRACKAALDNLIAANNERRAPR